MAAGRSLKSLVGRRRRVDGEGEEDEGPVVVADSQSEGSMFSEADDGDADASSLGDANPAGAETADGAAEAAQKGVKSAKKARKSKRKGKRVKEPSQDAAQPQMSFKHMGDTEAMMNGLQIDDQAGSQDAVDFEAMDQHGEATTAASPSSPAPNGHSEITADRPRREIEEYRKTRDADPAFIPNRGNFYMHDTRGQSNGQAPAPVRGAWPGRGRGKGVANAGGPFSPANQMAQAERAAQQPWKHDLHDTINEELLAAQPPIKPVDPPPEQDETYSARLFPRLVPPATSAQSRKLSFSSTTLIGKIQIRVFLPGMSAPILFSGVPWKNYIRLPDHRPPLRRDKPVRISIPPNTQRYIFPSTDRSFIFIPRQMRPNQQSFGRGSYQRSVAGYSSRRPSVYGGSMYSASVAASRRSSLAGVSRENAFSPTSFGGGMPPPNRPVVRLPYGAQQFPGLTTPSGPLSGQHTPLGMSQIHTYPLPQQPVLQGTPTTMVHQPRPQKAISVTGIESPAALQQAPPVNEPQPFQNQLPAHMNEQPSTYSLPPPAYYSPRQQYNYPQQPHSGTPLSGIPEQAVNAPSFQPSHMQYGQAPYYGPYPPQQAYYYSPPAANGYPAMPIFMPPQGYMMPPPTQPMPLDAASQQPTSQPSEEQRNQSTQPQSGMLAHESNGMVFYLPASEARQQERSQSYQPAETFVPSYAMPGLPPPTPAPDAAYLYSSMPPSMQDIQPIYYPPQQSQQ